MKGKQNRPQRPGRRKDSGQNADDDSPPKKRKTHSGTPRPTTPTTPDHKGFVDLFYNFWIQKSHHFYSFWIQIFFVHFYNFWIQKLQYFYGFWIQKPRHVYNFWIQKFFDPYSQFLDPESAVFLQFLQHFCNFLIIK